MPSVVDGVARSARWSPGVYHDAPRHRPVVIGGATTVGAALDAYALSLP